MVYFNFFLFRDSKEGLVETLESVRKSLTHESQDVRHFGLMKLKAVLQKNQTIVQQLILDSEKAHESISEIFTFLLGELLLSILLKSPFYNTM